MKKCSVPHLAIWTQIQRHFRRKEILTCMAGIKDMLICIQISDHKKIEKYTCIVLVNTKIRNGGDKTELWDNHKT